MVVCLNPKGENFFLLKFVYWIEFNFTHTHTDLLEEEDRTLKDSRSRANQSIAFDVFNCKLFPRIYLIWFNIVNA